MPGVELPFAYVVLLCPLVVIWYIVTAVGIIIENTRTLGVLIPVWCSKVILA
ncbi:phage holin family protein [uncultured Flavonifractor sp.]|uniref:phage holin family protein n=1 Tax=uncultured Flavonifractor sp. TaxID=1193534 RepID=UPI00262137D8|nr:phage holin family protein [uncultured Flavonifractor sp.]